MDCSKLFLLGVGCVKIPYLLKECHSLYMVSNNLHPEEVETIQTLLEELNNSPSLCYHFSFRWGVLLEDCLYEVAMSPVLGRPLFEENQLAGLVKLFL